MFTDEEENRVSLIESSINDMITWLGNTFSQREGRQMVLNQQETIDNLTIRVAALETQLGLIVARLDVLP
jgi:hypothetical protein